MDLPRAIGVSSPGPRQTPEVAAPFHLAEQVALVYPVVLSFAEVVETRAK